MTTRRLKQPARKSTSKPDYQPGPCRFGWFWASRPVPVTEFKGWQVGWLDPLGLKSQHLIPGAIQKWMARRVPRLDYQWR